jgi:Flp pilus assembly protein TadD
VRLWLAGGVAFAATMLARLVVLGAPAGRASMAAPGLDALSGAERVLMMLSLWPRIASMLLWPGDLSPYYGPTTIPVRRVALATLAVVAAIALAGLAVAAARRGDRRPLVALGWAALGYFPASNLLVATGVILADRVLFSVTVGAALGLAWLVDRLTGRVRTALLVVCAVATVRGAAERVVYAVDWTTHRRLWTRLVEASPDEYRGHQLLGIDARERGDTALARPLLARAFAMEPRDRRVRFEYGQVLYTTGQHEMAARTLAPLLADGGVRSEPAFVALYLDAVGRARGAEGVVSAGVPLLGTEAAAVAALYVGAAYERLGRRAAADSAYAIGLRAQPADTLLASRRRALLRGPSPR